MMAKVDTYPAITFSGVRVTSQVGDAPAGVRFDWPNGDSLFVSLPEQGMYLDAVDFHGEPWAIVSGQQSNAAYLVRSSGWDIIGITHGIRAVAIQVVDGELWHVFVRANADRSVTHYVWNGEPIPLPPDQANTSQGILALEPSGRINWAAPPDRRELVGGVELYHKVTVGDVSAGLLSEEDQLSVVDNTGPHTIHLGLAHQIRLTALASGRTGVSARLPEGAVFSEGPPWPAFVKPKPNVPAYGRAVPQFAYYTYSSDRPYGNHPDEVLHLAWCETASDIAQANVRGQYVITNRDLIGRAFKKAFVMVSNDYAGAPPLQLSVDLATQDCLEHKVRMVVYDERNERPHLPPFAIWTVRCFREPNETLAQWKDRARTMIDDAGQLDVCVIFGVDDRAGRLSKAVLRETALAATEILREKTKVVLAGWFSYARSAINEVTGEHIPPGGAILYPDVWAVVKASAAASAPIDPARYVLKVDPAPVPKPVPTPKPIPAPPPAPQEPRMPESITAPICREVVNWRFHDIDKGQERRPVEQARGDETTVIVPKRVINGKQTYAIQVGDEWVSVQTNGTIESRKASAEPGAFELFYGDSARNALVEAIDLWPDKMAAGRKPVTFVVAAPLP